MKIKTIGLFNDSFPPIYDGVATVVYNYADYLLKTEGFRPVVVTVSAQTKLETPFEVLRFFSVPLTLRKPYRLGLPYLDVNFMKKIRDINFSLIHAHSPFSAGRLALKIA